MGKTKGKAPHHPSVYGENYWKPNPKPKLKGNLKEWQSWNHCLIWKYGGNPLKWYDMGIWVIALFKINGN
jgi:hypothetical protein